MAESTLAPSDSTLNLGQSKASENNLFTFIGELPGCHLGVIQQLRRVFEWVVFFWSCDPIYWQEDEQCGKDDCMHMQGNDVSVESRRAYRKLSRPCLP